MLAKKNDGVSVTVYTHRRTRLRNMDVQNFNAQYPALEVKYTSVFHDRFLILGRKTACHIGASLKDADKFKTADWILFTILRITLATVDALTSSNTITSFFVIEP